MMQFESALQALSDGNVDFVVIGGLAGTLHGSSQVTYDLDVCYSRTSANLIRIAKALAPFHPRPRGSPSDLPFVWDEVTLRNGTIFTLQTDIGAIDLLAEVTGLGTYDEVRKDAVIIQAFDRDVATLDLRALIRAKRAAGRAKDLAAVAELESLLEAGQG